MTDVHRYATPADLAEGVAQRLLETLVRRQGETDDPVQLCLTGGRIANRMYEEFASRAVDSPLDPSRLELWWGDERFVPTEDASRHAGHTLSILAGYLHLVPSLIHPMPAADGLADSAASATAYAKELGDTTFDVTLLGLGPDGHVASVFPDHPSFEASQHTVIGVTEAPKPPGARITLTVEALNRSREVWYVVSGDDKAGAVARAVTDDVTIPGGVVRGRERTLWLLDRAAGLGLPYHSCSF